MKIGMIGLGNMGTAVANNIASNGHKVTGWEYNDKTVNEVNKKHRNSKYLKGIALHKNISATSDIINALSEKDIIFMALPSKYIRSVFTPGVVKYAGKTVIVNLSKGIEEKTCLTSSGMLAEIFKDSEVVTLSGPSIANEFARRQPCMVMLSGKNRLLLSRVAGAIETSVFKTVFSNDTAGVEWSGILKNMYAIGLGVIHGLGFESLNFKAAYITLAMQEITELVEAMGGRRKTAYNLAGLGDLIATSLSTHSHNWKLGGLVVKGKTLKQAEKIMGILPEGVKSLRAARYLSKKRGIKMPVAEALLKVIDGKIGPSVLVRKILTHRTSPN